MMNVRRIFNIKNGVRVLCILLTFTLLSAEGRAALVQGVVKYYSSEYSSFRPAPDCIVVLLDSPNSDQWGLEDLPVIAIARCNYNGEYKFTIDEQGTYYVAAYWDWENKLKINALTKMDGDIEVIDLYSIMGIPGGISEPFTLRPGEESSEVNVKLFNNVWLERTEKDITIEKLFQNREGLKLFGTIKTQNGLPVKLDSFEIYKETGDEEIGWNYLHLFPILKDDGYACLITEPGFYRISADAGDYLGYYEKLIIDNPEGERRVDIILKSKYSLTGKIMSKQKAPLSDVEVAIYDATGKFIRLGESRKDGEYRVDFNIGTEFKEKIVKVEAEKEGYKSEKCTINFTKEREQEKNFTLTKLPEPPIYEGMISGTLKDTFGNSINDVTVDACLVTTFERGKLDITKIYSDRTNVNSQYSIKDLPEGKYYINPHIISVGKYSIFGPEPGIRKVVLEKDEKLKVDFVFIVGGIFKGRVKFESGEIPIGTEIYLNPIDEIDIIAREESQVPVPVNENGSFEFQKAYPGENEVILKIGNQKFKLGEVGIIPQEEISKNFSFTLPELGQSNIQ